MYGGGTNKVVIAGAVDTNGIAAANINGTHTIANITHDSYTITALNSDVSTNSSAGAGAGGGGGRGRGGHVGWTAEERMRLWECYTLSGGKSKRGYTNRMKELWDQRNLTPRSKASLVTQLGTIERGGLTQMVREEIEHKVASC